MTRSARPGDQLARASRLLSLFVMLGLLAVSPLACFVWGADGVLCVPASSSRPELVGTWQLTSEALANELLVLRADGTLRAVTLTEGLPPQTTDVHTLRWGLDGGVLELGGSAVPPSQWAVGTSELTVDAFGGHAAHYRRVWCVGE